MPAAAADAHVVSDAVRRLRSDAALAILAAGNRDAQAVVEVGERIRVSLPDCREAALARGVAVDCGRWLLRLPAWPAALEKPLGPMREFLRAEPPDAVWCLALSMLAEAPGSTLAVRPAGGGAALIDGIMGVSRDALAMLEIMLAPPEPPAVKRQPGAEATPGDADGGPTAITGEDWRGKLLALRDAVREKAGADAADRIDELYRMKQAELLDLMATHYVYTATDDSRGRDRKAVSRAIKELRDSGDWQARKPPAPKAEPPTQHRDEGADAISAEQAADFAMGGGSGVTRIRKPSTPRPSSRRCSTRACVNPAAAGSMRCSQCASGERPMLRSLSDADANRVAEFWRQHPDDSADPETAYKAAAFSDDDFEG